MAVKFGMTLAQIFNQLVKGYQKIKRTEPKGLDLIKIKQEAMQRFKDMNKVVDMGGRPIDTSKGIMGGVQVGQKGIFDNIFNRMQSQMGKNIKEVKNKKPDPEKKAMGGRIGLKEGEGIMQMASVDDPSPSLKAARPPSANVIDGAPLSFLPIKSIISSI